MLSAPFVVLLAVDWLKYENEVAMALFLTLAAFVAMRSVYLPVRGARRAPPSRHPRGTRFHGHSRPLVSCIEQRSTRYPSTPPRAVCSVRLLVIVPR